MHVVPDPTAGPALGLDPLTPPLSEDGRAVTMGGVQSFTGSSSLELVVQSLAPGIKKVLVKKSEQTKSAIPPGSGLLGFVPAHPPLLLSGLPSKVTQQQVFSTVEKFGKSRLISVAQQEAMVYFLQEAAAHALLGFTELKIGGNPITVTQIAVPGTTTVPHLLPTPGSSVLVQSSATMAVNVVAEPPSSSVQCNKTTVPGIKTTTPGTKGTTPGSKKATPGSKKATPGNKKATPGNKKATPGNKKATPGNATTTPGSKTTTPGNKTTTPGNKKTTPGKKTTMHANKTPTPSKSTTTPDNKVTTPGNKAATPGNKTATPGSTTMPSKKMIPGNTITTPVNKTATPANKMAPPVNITITPGSDTTTTGNATTMSENKTTTPGNKTTVLCKTTS
ncbi:unnamed protein product [Arctogadus glacialis]